jgi:hypothetical protein
MLPTAKPFWFSTTAAHMSPLRNSLPASSWETHVSCTFLPIWRPRSSPVMPASSAILRPITTVASIVSCCSALRTTLTKQKKLMCYRPSSLLFLFRQQMSRLQPSRIATGITRSARQRALGRQHQLRRTSLTRTSLMS